MPVLQPLLARLPVAAAPAGDVYFGGPGTLLVDTVASFNQRSDEDIKDGCGRQHSEVPYVR